MPTPPVTLRVTLTEKQARCVLELAASGWENKGGAKRRAFDRAMHEIRRALRSEIELRDLSRANGLDRQRRIRRWI